tara:strand:- start:7921 stop:8088 length:168 start_codon:yes stop_codon:yes gene_type:complete
MKEENDIERPIKGPDNDFRKMVGMYLSLTIGISLAVSAMVTILIGLLFVGWNYLN